MQLFLNKRDVEQHGSTITYLLADHLPGTFLGYPTNLESLEANGTRHMRTTMGRLHHGVVVAELDDWLTGHLVA